jgi:hypothetical protein
MLAYAPLLLLPVATGCGESKGTVSGRVLYKDKPVPGGFVMFEPTQAGHKPVTTELDAEGHYQVTVAAGEVRISVDNRELAPLPPPPPPPVLPPALPGAIPPGAKLDQPHGPDKSAAKPHAGRYVEIPPKYYQTDTSELKYTVKSGSQTHDIKLD